MWPSCSNGGSTQKILNPPSAYMTGDEDDLFTRGGQVLESMRVAARSLVDEAVPQRQGPFTQDVLSMKPIYFNGLRRTRTGRDTFSDLEELREPLDDSPIPHLLDLPASGNQASGQGPPPTMTPCPPQGTRLPVKGPPPVVEGAFMKPPFPTLRWPQIRP
ncbi:hypothetical protein DPX16_0236 [Anabarilius grahami]|uniref:Uncharacterized protein n=1 Tax=Anabarilius grahami TaxID=495550 RepID=A0A3N0Z5C6_ANAGA|nr:hypothetical protein DPX16_0236 [Anabarilius grahami]